MSLPSGAFMGYGSATIGSVVINDMHSAHFLSPDHAVLTPEPDDGRVLSAAGGQVCGHAKGEGAEEDPADPGESLEHRGRRQYQHDEHPADPVGDHCDHTANAEPTATGESCSSHRCHFDTAPVAATTSGSRSAAAALAG